jgi:hypothetical protein
MGPGKIAEKLEPGFRQLDAVTATADMTQAYALTSIAVSLKRIADLLEKDVNNGD